MRKMKRERTRLLATRLDIKVDEVLVADGSAIDMLLSFPAVARLEITYRSGDVVTYFADDWAEVQEAVPETDEPALCGCGQHYVGSPCPVYPKEDQS